MFFDVLAIVICASAAAWLVIARR
ncbi:hypothetical protein KNV15_gp38 [Gordonia phage Jambalaya]|nr:hypothetical protein KNV15_gp38 [Gordonia phage Jambalaya]QLF84086.1 hypothetical protein SEA_JAMBALAYA_38 [Gordonia phage Jambalaya]